MEEVSGELDDNKIPYSTENVKVKRNSKESHGIPKTNSQLKILSDHGDGISKDKGKLNSGRASATTGDEEGKTSLLNGLGCYSQKVMDQLLSGPDLRREQFRLYLEETHILDALARFFIGLYDKIDDSPPDNLVEYFLQTLSSVVAIKAEADQLQSDVDNLREKYGQLGADNQRIRERLMLYENVQPEYEEDVNE